LPRSDVRVFWVPNKNSSFQIRVHSCLSVVTSAFWPCLPPQGDTIDRTLRILSCLNSLPPHDFRLKSILRWTKLRVLSAPCGTPGNADKIAPAPPLCGSPSG